MLALLKLIPAPIRCAIGLHFWKARWWSYDPAQRILEINLHCTRCGRSVISWFLISTEPFPNTPRVSFLRGPLDKEIPEIL